MIVVSGVRFLEEALGPSVVTIGNFDGVHRAHRFIIDKACKKKRPNEKVVVYTFKPHPRIALANKKVELLSTYRERMEHISLLKPDVFIEEPFNREFSSHPPETFFEEVLVSKLGARSIVIGYDFGFGKDRKGNLDSLKRLCAAQKIDLEVVEPQEYDGERASSSRIRDLMRKPDLPRANMLLGYEFFYGGVVQRGDARGRELGFPTANIPVPEPKLVLPYGIYATRLEVDGRTHPAVTSVGVRPTFKPVSPVPLVETFVLEQKQLDLYGKAIRVRFVDFIRPEKKFDSVDALRDQMHHDVKEAAHRLTASS